ncbi:MAG: peptidoglycan DD-metalloendopeptidase family protein [Anaerolineales bacterium]|nr:peptidoglycan DD-metalloendopeptidase family protein [Anaerolineales bacterium]
MSSPENTPPEIKKKLVFQEGRGFQQLIRKRLKPFQSVSWRRLTTLHAKLYTAGLLAIGGLILFAVKKSSDIQMGAASGTELSNTASVASPALNEQLDMGLLPLYQSLPDENGGIRRRSDLHTIIPDRPRLDVVKYTVEAGDSLFGIADKYGLRPETILWGNYDVLQDDPHSLRPGLELNILPVDGTYYEWHDEDGLNAVASFFGVDPQEIIDWPGNNLTPHLDPSNPNIEPGTQLVIPGGKREFVSWQAPRITRGNPAVAKIAGPGACGSIYDGPVGEGFFVWPTSATYLSGNSYSSFHPGIDIAGSTGNAIFASASGVVVYAGWNNYGYGYMVVIDHGDGWQTLYAHMSQVNVVCGQAAFQGGVIGGIGSSGNSTGSHLHFEMQHDAYGKVNPYDLVSP